MLAGMRTIVLTVLLAGCSGTPTTADVPRSDIYAYCDVASDGSVTTVSLRSHPQLAKGDAFFLRTEAGDVRLSPYSSDVAGKGPHPVGRDFAAKLPPVRSVSVGLRHQGVDRWVDIRLPPAPNLSDAPGEIPAVVWEGSRETAVVIRAACAGDADPKHVATMQVPDVGRIEIHKIFSEADLKVPALKECEELTIVLSRTSNENLAGLGANPFLRCSVEQLRSTRVKRPKLMGEADASPNP